MLRVSSGFAGEFLIFSADGDAVIFYSGIYVIIGMQMKKQWPESGCFLLGALQSMLLVEVSDSAGPAEAQAWTSAAL